MSGEVLSLPARQKRFKAYVFAFEQVLALACYWLLRVSDNRFKSSLGYSIGYAGMALGKLTDRLGQMFTEPVGCPPSCDYARLFSEAVILTKPSDMAQFLCRTVSGVSESMGEYLHLGNGIEDEPSLIVLQETQAVLDRAVQALSTWCEAVPTSLPANGISFDGETADSTQFQKLVLPPLPSTPTREPGLRFHPRPDLNPDVLTYEATALDEESLRRLVHFIYLDIEIVAMESCARNILEFQEMPMEFRLDMARQIWDEARHATFMRRRLEEMGSHVGQYSYSLVSWNNYMRGENLAERLAIQQVVLEGNGLDAGILIARVASDNNDHRTAEVFQYQNMDETVHARIGNKWLVFLVGQSYEQYEQFVLRMAAYCLN